jgi:inhibitor of cysteine peptidase
VKKMKIALGCLIIAALTGCWAPGAVRVSLDKDLTIDIKQGQTLEVELEANPTTGYSWDVTGSVNAGVLRQKRKFKYIPESDLVGAGGIQIFYFEGLQRGKAELTFEYRRPWEKDTEPAGKHIVRVNVH